MDKFQFNTERFLKLVEKLVNEGKNLINNPPNYIPKESLAGRHILEQLKQFDKQNGGVLDIKEIAYEPERGNIIIKYESSLNPNKNTLSFIGSHLDVVHANEAEWERNPFQFSQEGDKIFGRGTTDCLGHCALMTELFIQLATHKPQLNMDIIGVIIVDEEAGSGSGVGVEGLMEKGELNQLKNGPVYWLDCADAQPNIGSGGLLKWSLKVTGSKGHSGFPNKGINAIELAMDSLKYIQDNFYKDFNRHELEDKYGFPMSSSMKPTKLNVPESSLNQIPGFCEIQGDVRLIPFYDIHDCYQKIMSYVKQLNEKQFSQLEPRGRDMKYHRENAQATVEFIKLGDLVSGLACDINSIGFKSLEKATIDIYGECKPIADTGTLPLVGDLRKNGYDIQTVGYGVEDAYHADNEFALISEFQKGFQVITKLIGLINQQYQ